MRVIESIAAERLREAADAMKKAVLALKWIDDAAASRMASEEEAARKLALDLSLRNQRSNARVERPGAASGDRSARTTGCAANGKDEKQ